MKVSELIDQFAGRARLPVDVNDLLPVLRQNGHETDIQFIGVDLDPEVLQGKIKVWHERPVMYGEPQRFANIYYHRGHDVDWQRFICCKELFHLLDPEGAQTCSPADVERLAEEIGLPPYMQDPRSEGWATNVDRVAEFRAAAVLLPLASRALLVQPLAEKRVTLTDIAVMADIPSKYVAFVMSPGWEPLHDLLAK